MNHNTLILAVAAFATLGVITRPLRLPEHVWAVVGAVVLIACGFFPWRNAVAAAANGMDVYLFLIGMMLLAEVARQEGLFDWLAALAIRYAGGSARRLFLIIYAVGTLVTVFLSNDATAVVLTPAVYAAATAARVEPLPYLFICAFIANAASFVLPISNPANLVIFGTHMPPLAQWLYEFTLPSIASILITYLLLRFTLRAAVDQRISEDFQTEPLSVAGKYVAVGISLTAVVLLGASSFDRQLGLPTFIAGTAVTSIVLIISRQSPLPVLRHLMGSIAARCRTVHIGRGCRADWDFEFGHAEASQCRGILASGGFFRCRHHPRSRFKPDEQPSDWLGRCHGQPKCPCPPASDERSIDRRRSWPQPLRDGFARDNSVAIRAEARRRSCDSGTVPETWNTRHAFSISGGPFGNHSGAIATNVRLWPYALYCRLRDLGRLRGITDARLWIGVEP